MFYLDIVIRTKPYRNTRNLRHLSYLIVLPMNRDSFIPHRLFALLMLYRYVHLCMNGRGLSQQRAVPH